MTYNFAFITIRIASCRISDFCNTGLQTESVVGYQRCYSLLVRFQRFSALLSKIAVRICPIFCIVDHVGQTPFLENLNQRSQENQIFRTNFSKRHGKGIPTHLLVCIRISLSQSKSFVLSLIILTDRNSRLHSHILLT